MKEGRRYELPYIVLLVFRLEVEIRRCWLGLLIEKYFFDVLTEETRNLNSQGQARIVFARLNGIDGLARDADPGGQLRLRPLDFRPQNTQPGLHRYRQEKRNRPTLQAMSCRASMPPHDTSETPKPCTKPPRRETSRVAVKPNRRAW